MATTSEKRIMLSYNWKSQQVVSKVYDILRAANISVWMDIKGGMKDDIYKSMSEGIEKADIVACFMSPEYQASVNCKLELQYAQTRGKRIIPCIITEKKKWKPEGWLGLITAGLNHINFKEDSDDYIQLKADELISRIKDTPLVERQPTEPTYLIELVKHKYTKNARIERVMNPAKSYPMQQSYINLAIVKFKEQQEKEKELRDARHGETIISSFEEIYGTKTSVDVEDIFETCKNEEKQVLVFGRPGIGKSTFCRYTAYQWANGTYWSQYKLLALIPLRRLTTDRYPLNKDYTLIDIFKREVFDLDLTEKDDKLFRKQFDLNKTLWILDGYDEIVQNTPPHLKMILEQLLKTPHHIITSRPYMNTLSYDVQMEITGFTDENIQQYVQQFFEQMKDELDDATLISQKLYHFLRANRSIWGVAHIPVNLELICSLWSNNDWTEDEQITITTLYTMITEWLCRRYLRTADNHVSQLSNSEIEQRCHKELAFLEYLAFNAMESNAIVLRPVLLQAAITTTNLSIQEHPNFLNIGVLKSFHKSGVGNQIEINKDHYFVHLSFQEYFTARHLIHMLNGSSTEKAIEFIKHQKYNQRYSLVFAFAAGLASYKQMTPTFTLFWDTLLTEPIDIVGIRHMQLLLLCVEETIDKKPIPQWSRLLDTIGQCIQYAILTHNNIMFAQLPSLVNRAQSVLSLQQIQHIFIDLIQSHNTNITRNALRFIASIDLLNPTLLLVSLIAHNLSHESEDIAKSACTALSEMGEKAAKAEVINSLVNLLADERKLTRARACYVLEQMGEKVATVEVVHKLASLMEDENAKLRIGVRCALRMMGEKAATAEVINKLVSLLEDDNEGIRADACYALHNMDKKAAAPEAINKLVSLLGDDNGEIRSRAQYILGNMGEKAVTTEVINKLVSLLGNDNEDIRSKACNTLGNMAEKAATTEVINKLAGLVGDDKEEVRKHASDALEQMGEKAVTIEVINKLVSLLGDDNEDTRSKACDTLRNMGKIAATPEVINKLVSLLEDDNEGIRADACYALHNMDKKAAAPEVVEKLVSLVRDDNEEISDSACDALQEMCEKTVTTEVINKLVALLEDHNEKTRSSACYALGKMGEKAATTELINKLVGLLEDDNEEIRKHVCYALGKMGEKVATTEVINKVVSLLEDHNEKTRSSACYALGKMGEKAATTELINKLVDLLEDDNEEIRKHVCYALGKMGEKAATTEVINKLVVLLEDDNEEISDSACDALQEMCEKTVTTEVINKLVALLEDHNERTRSGACYALAAMGEKAATTEVTKKLVSLLGDHSEKTRSGACYALGKMGEKTATTEVINKLVGLLEDDNERIRKHVCYALKKMGEKAATTEVINKLVALLKDDNERIRSACYALGMMGEKATTNEVLNKLACLVDKWLVQIGRPDGRYPSFLDVESPTTEVKNNLVSLLGDENGGVRSFALDVLRKLDENAVITEVLNKLIALLEDENPEIRAGACYALVYMGDHAVTTEVKNKLVGLMQAANEQSRLLGRYVLRKMGEKAATTEVINKLLSFLDNEDVGMRISACDVFGQMGEKAATTEVIDKLVGLLEDVNEWVRRSACYALGEMGEKAATTEVINKVVSLREDVNEWVRRSVCYALGQMGEKAATTEVINKVVSLLEDVNKRVRGSACGALGQMGEKAGTPEVINKLVSLLEDEGVWDSAGASDALKKMGKKAAVTEVITRLMDALESVSGMKQYALRELVECILSSSEAVAQLAPSTVSRICRHRYGADWLKNLSEHKLIEAFAVTKDTEWLTAIVYLSIFRGSGYVMVKEKIVFYSDEEPKEVPIADAQSRQQFIEAFVLQAKELHLYFEAPSMTAGQLPNEINKMSLQSEGEKISSQGTIDVPRRTERMGTEVKSSRFCNIL